MSDEIPDDWKRRSPLMTGEGWQRLQRLRQHPSAPRWNFETGDRLVAGDLEIVETFRTELHDRATLPSSAEVPPEWMLTAIERLRSRSWYVEQQVPTGFDLRRDWAHVPTMSRDDLATRISEIVPHDIETFDRLLVYDTSGTSGHAVRVPHDPLLLARSHTFAEWAASRHGAPLEMDTSEVACLNLCAQAHTYVFASIFTVWNEAGFVKANLNERDWAGGPDAARDYLGELDARLVTSDPISLAEAMRWDIPLRPRAIISTAVALQPRLRERFAAHFGCPVIDWYSTTETGPIACSAAEGEGWEVLPHDLFVEVVDDRGLPVDALQPGEICVTTLRNPFLPLVRYRTGDRAVLERGPVPRLLDLQGRAAVFFRDAAGGAVSSVDVGRAMRLVATFAQHEFVQRADRSCAVAIRRVPGLSVDREQVLAALHELFGDVEIELEFDDELGREEKVVAYHSELEL